MAGREREHKVAKGSLRPGHAPLGSLEVLAMAGIGLIAFHPRA
jgi:hypothetical protein